ncbi:hypothetical protein PG997_010910 [Apiospora hydei]|uniref:FAD-binding PCMH-type domain-containing protein n=1 Tax=Apiospora hydei TaxID=1337664 RepID=A0ABR1VHT1_9PEZI
MGSIHQTSEGRQRKQEADIFFTPETQEASTSSATSSDDVFTETRPAKRVEPTTSGGPSQERPSTPTGTGQRPVGQQLTPSSSPITTSNTATKKPVPKTLVNCTRSESPAAELMNHCRANRIRVYNPGQLEYERSVASTNLLYRYTRPDCVIQPATGDDVARVVRFCYEAKIKLTVRSGGHSYAGFATTDEGALMDMRRMNRTSLDMRNQVLYADGGALWADVYKRIINGRHDGFAPKGGRCPSVGVSGFLMGAGLGPFSRGLGMGSDSVLAITAVTAQGDTVTVTHKDDPESPSGRLFWALRGAGGGNFGVVVQWKLQVKKLQDPLGMVTAGRYVWSYKPDDFVARSEQDQLDIEDSITRTISSFYAYNWPDRITIDATWLRRADNKLGTQVRFTSYCDGGSDFFSDHIDAAFFGNENVRRQLKRRCIEEKSSRFLHETLAAQWSEETLRSIPNSTEFRLFAGFAVDCRKQMQDMNNTILAVKEFDVFGEQFKGERAECSVSFIHTGGRAGAASRGATPYRWREASYQCYIMITFLDKWVERDMRGFLARFKAKLKPYSLAQQAVFVNFANAALPAAGYEAAYYGGNLTKLRQVKQEWDPDDFFHWQQSVQLPAEKRVIPALVSTVSGPEGDPPAPPVEATANEQDQTDAIATKGWECGFEVATSEPLSSNMFGRNVLGDSSLGLYPSIKPGLKANNVTWIYEVSESLPLTGEFGDPTVFG